MSDSVQAKSDWVRRVLDMDVATQASGPVDPAAEGQDVGEEGPLEQGQVRKDDYRDLLRRIDEELDYPKGLQDATYGLTREQVQLKGKYPGWAGRRTQLGRNEADVNRAAAAADFPTLQRHVDAAQGLLKEVVVACGNAGVSTPGGLRGVPHRKAIVDTLLSCADSAKQPDAEAIADELGQAGDAAVWDVEGLVQRASALVDGTKLREKLGDTLAVIATYAKGYPPVNPVAPALEALLDRTTEGDMLTGAPAAELWASALSEAEPLAKTAKSTAGVRTHILNALHVAEVLVLQTPKGTTDRGGHLTAIGEARTACRKASGEARTVDDLNTRWTAMLKDATDLQKVVTDWRKAFIDAASVKADLLELYKLVNNKTFWDTPDTKKRYDEIPDIVERSRTPPASLDGKSPQELQAFAAQLAKDIRTASDLLVRDRDPKALDDMLSARRDTGDTADSVGATAFWQAALEARYGLKINVPDGVQATKLPQLYDFFKRLPDSQVVKDMIKTFDYDTESGPCKFEKGSARILMNNMSKELPAGAEEVLKYPLPGSSDKELVDYFSIVTLHEIGHAVDAKNSFMKNNTNTATLGDWQDVKLDDVVKIVAGDIANGLTPAPPPEDVAKLVRRFLLTGKVDTPPSASAPMGSLLPAWDTLSTKLAAYAEITMKAGKPWEKSHAMSDKRCYHEGYAGRWVSYGADERKSSVSLYQWRAPGEWFAELYAWHYIEPDATKRRRRTAALPSALQTVIAGT